MAYTPHVLQRVGHGLLLVARQAVGLRRAVAQMLEQQQSAEEVAQRTGWHAAVVQLRHEVGGRQAVLVEQAVGEAAQLGLQHGGVGMAVAQNHLLEGVAEGQQAEDVVGQQLAGLG